jgi:hypothetical protein
VVRVVSVVSVVPVLLCSQPAGHLGPRARHSEQMAGFH